MRKLKVYYAYYDLKTNLIEIGCELKDDFGYVEKKTIETLDDLCEKECIIYINDLGAIAGLLKGGEEKSRSKTKGDLILYNYKKAKIKSFSVLKPANTSMTHLLELYKAESMTRMMYDYISQYGGPYKISKTISAQAKKEFYAPISFCLWKDAVVNHRFINSVKEWELLYAGRKSGLLKDVNKIKFYDNVIAYDLKSAYAGAFIQDDKFPIGKPRFTTDKKVLSESLKNKKWCKVVFYDYIKELFDYIDTRTGTIAVEYYDFFTLALQGIDVLSLVNKYKCTIVYSDKTGYLHPDFRKRTMYYYNEKNNCGKDTPERLLKKAPLESLYGKSIQWQDFDSDHKVINHYRGRGENYLLPHMGNHASAYVRYVIAKILYDFGDDCIYWDTDGVKIKKSDKVIKYFNNFNDRIYKKNIKSGFNTDIGTFEVEADMQYFCEIRSKIYLYNEIDKPIVTKMAGFDEYAKDMAIYYSKMHKKEDENIYQDFEKNGVFFLSKVTTEDNRKIKISYSKSILSPIRDDNEEINCVTIT